MMTHRRFVALHVSVGRTALLVGILGLVMSPAIVEAQAVDTGISLTPAVVELKGTFGQAHRQALSVTNNTQLVLEFELVAEDIVIENGRRTFLQAGQRPDSIAATALFSPQRVLVAPGKTATASMTITVPPGTSVRALAAIFRGVTQVDVRDGVSMTGSLGSLMTFTLSENARLEASEIEISNQTETTNLAFAQDVINVGTEPVVTSGAIAVTDADGRLVTRIPVESHRLLPGEHIRIVGDYPGQLPSGRYQAFLSMVFGPQLLSRSTTFNVTSNADAPDAALPGRAGDR